MQVVLLERIEKLGIMGDVVSVKNGYARNFLLPQHKALRATDKNLAEFEERRAQLEARNLEARKEAEAVAGKMQDITVVLVRQASESDHLYGSVSVRDIATALGEQKYTVDHKQIAMDKPIKMVGIQTVRVVLHPEVSVDVSVNVARSEEEAEAQADITEEAVLAEAESVFESEELAQQAVEELVESEEEPEAEFIDADASEEDTETADEEADEADEADEEAESADSAEESKE